MFPSRAAPEVQLITAWLLDIGATVYYADVPGAWDLFWRKQKNYTRSGLVLYHPSMNQYWKFPDLQYSLFSGHYNHFQIGVDGGLTYHPGAAARYSAVRLFVHGSATLITDDVFEHHPSRAAYVLEIFCKEYVKAGGASDYKIVTRPGLKEWLLDLLDKHKHLPDAADRLRLYHAVQRLLPDSYEETDILPIETPHLISPRALELPDYARKWDVDEEEATEWLVQWFAGMTVLVISKRLPREILTVHRRIGWSMLERENIRKFIIVHEQSRKPEQTPGVGTEKDPRLWSKKFNHIKVMNAKRWTEFARRK